MKMSFSAKPALLGRLTALAIMATGLTAPALPDEAVETDSYRVGQTYSSERARGLQACAQTCAEDQRCVAWSLTPPTFRVGPRCELKSSAGQAQARPGYTSGLSGVNAAPQMSRIPTQSASAPSTRPARSDVLAGGYAQSRQTATNGTSMPPSPDGAATSHMLPTPVSPSVQQAPVRRQVQPTTRTQLASNTTTRPATTSVASRARTQQTSRQPSSSTPTITSRVTTRPVQRPAATAVAAQRPAASSTPTRTVTRRTVSSSTPAPTATQSQAAATAAARSTVSRAASTSTQRPSAPATTSAVDTRPPLPRPSRLPSLPSPLQRNGTAYSVQRMGDMPGDVEAAAGYVDGLPANARVEPIARNNRERDRSSDDENGSDEEASWPEGYPEYPDPLGGPIGSTVMDED